MPLSLGIGLIALIIIGMSWLFLLLLVIFTVYRLLKLLISRNYFLFLFFAVLAAIITAILIRIFIVELYKVPSESMEEALFKGDRIVVSKLNYGPKMPSSPTEIPWINLLFSRKTLKSSYLHWRYKRLSGFSSIERNDIIVFKKSNNDGDFLVKRCIGLPGETIRIDSTEIFINDKLIGNQPTVKYHYKLSVSDKSRFIDFLNSRYLKFRNTSDSNYVDILLTEVELKQLVKSGLLNAIAYNKAFNSDFASRQNSSWTTDHFGPLKIPFKGLVIPINKYNFLLYKDIIQEIEGSSLDVNEGNYYLNKKLITTYTFRKDCFFALGDNRNNSYDSRFWGFVSETNLEGKVIAVL